MRHVLSGIEADISQSPPLGRILEANRSPRDGACTLSALAEPSPFWARVDILG